MCLYHDKRGQNNSKKYTKIELIPESIKTRHRDNLNTLKIRRRVCDVSY